MKHAKDVFCFILSTYSPNPNFPAIDFLFSITNAKRISKYMQENQIKKLCITSAILYVLEQKNEKTQKKLKEANLNK